MNVFLPKTHQVFYQTLLGKIKFNALRTFLAISFLLLPTGLAAQTYNNAYAKALHKKYPSVKTDFCGSCKLWVNPYYRSIADTARHMPLVTFYVYTKSMRLEQERLKAEGFDREGVFAQWFPSVGQEKEDTFYSKVNPMIGVAASDNRSIQKGHCQPWILLAFNKDAAILSNTYTFNSAMEYKGQNIGTEIESEELCRELTGFEGHQLITEKIGIWCGTFGSQRTYTYGNFTATVPTHYYKILQYFDLIQQKNVIRCFWMPNAPEETRDKLASREVSYTVLKSKLGFDPMAIFSNN